MGASRSDHGQPRPLSARAREVKRRLEEGTYRIDYDALAEALAEEVFGDDEPSAVARAGDGVAPARDGEEEGAPAAARHRRAGGRGRDIDAPHGDDGSDDGNDDDARAATAPTEP